VDDGITFIKVALAVVELAEPASRIVPDVPDVDNAGWRIS